MTRAWLFLSCSLRCCVWHVLLLFPQVLSIYPTTIRRRILRHLYLRHLRASYLFRGAPRKYLDSLLAASRLELFRPGVDLLAAGDAVNELFVVVAGKVELR